MSIQTLEELEKEVSYLVTRSEAIYGVALECFRELCAPLDDEIIKRRLDAAIAKKVDEAIRRKTTMFQMYESRVLTARRSTADFWYTFRHGDAYVVDLNFGGKSVTNDAEYVVSDLAAAAEKLGPYKVERFFYRDSGGNWDELKHDGPKFTGFGLIPHDDAHGYVWATIEEVDCLVDGK